MTKTNEDLNSIKNKLVRLENAAGLPLLNKEHSSTQVLLLPDKNVSPGLFKASRLCGRTYYAHPTTIRAVKKDIFMGGDGFEDLEDIRICKGEKHHMDKQFWHFCPLCEAEFHTSD